MPQYLQKPLRNTQRGCSADARKTLSCIHVHGDSELDSTLVFDRAEGAEVMVTELLCEGVQ